jgi:hypothetical protein
MEVCASVGNVYDGRKIFFVSRRERDTQIPSVSADTGLPDVKVSNIGVPGQLGADFGYHDLI